MSRRKNIAYDLDDLRARFIRGDTLTSIAEDLGVTVGRVSQITRSMGLRKYATVAPNEGPHDPRARFWSKVNKEGRAPRPSLGPCWEWTGSTSSGRGGCYGRFFFEGEILGAHVVSFFFEHGRWPSPACLHRCDNGVCVRPEHLYEGTQADNIADMQRRGRLVTHRGEAHGMAKLEAEDVRRARMMRGLGERYPTIARALGISVGHAHRICNGVAWKHVD